MRLHPDEEENEKLFCSRWRLPAKFANNLILFTDHTIWSPLSSFLNEGAGDRTQNNDKKKSADDTW